MLKNTVFLCLIILISYKNTNFVIQKYTINMRGLPSPEIEVIEEVDIDLENIKLWELVVINDDVNTFEYVIDTLMEVCGHSPEQAEQCTVIIHYKGKCGVKSGDYDEIVAMRTEICRRGISAEVMLR